MTLFFIIFYFFNILQFRRSCDVFTTITYVFFITLCQHHLVLILPIILNTSLKLFSVRLNSYKKKVVPMEFYILFSCIERCSQLTTSNDQRSLTRSKSNVSLSKFRIWQSLQRISHVIRCCAKYSNWFKW